MQASRLRRLKGRRPSTVTEVASRVCVCSSLLKFEILLTDKAFIVQVPRRAAKSEWAARGKRGGGPGLQGAERLPGNGAARLPVAVLRAARLLRQSVQHDPDLQGYWNPRCVCIRTTLITGRALSSGNLRSTIKVLTLLNRWQLPNLIPQAIRPCANYSTRAACSRFLCLLVDGISRLDLHCEVFACAICNGALHFACKT